MLLYHQTAILSSFIYIKIILLQIFYTLQRQLYTKKNCCKIIFATVLSLGQEELLEHISLGFFGNLTVIIRIFHTVLQVNEKLAGVFDTAPHEPYRGYDTDNCRNDQ